MKTESDLLTLPEVAEYLRVGKTKTYQLLRKGTLPGRKVGKEWRVSKQRLEAWLHQGLTPPEPSHIDRRAFLQLPLEERRRILAEQAAQAAAAYDPAEWEEWQGGDLVEY